MNYKKSKRRSCQTCRQYSFGLRKCLSGKVMPRTLKGARELVELMGFDYICHFYPHLRKLAT